MTNTELQQYLHEHIPLSAAMGVKVMQADPERVVLAAPLKPNINHRATVFGGSASALATLAAWSLVFLQLRQADLNARVVIQRNTVRYQKPMAGEFFATAVLGDPARWASFTRSVVRGRSARVAVAAVLSCAGQQAGEFEGDFVALAS